MQQFQYLLNDLYEKAFSLYKERTAVQFPNRELSYGELDTQTNQLAHAFIRSGIGVETPVASLMSNCVEYVLTDLAIMKAGATSVPLNDMLGEQEIVYLLQHSETKLAVIGPNFYELILRIRNELPELQTIVGTTNSVPEGFIPWNEFVAGAQSHLAPTVEIHSSHRAFLKYTGGTTGMPKAVSLTQEQVVMNIYCHLMELDLSEHDKMMLMTPLPHAAGKFLQVGLLKGIKHYIPEKFDPEKALELIEQEGITWTFMVPTMIYRMLDVLDRKPFNTSSMQTILYGGAPMAEEQLKRGLKKFGSVFHQIYGQAEAPILLTQLKKFDHNMDPDKIHRLRSCGKPTLMTRLQIVDENGNPLGPNEQGEVVIQSPFMMSGYHKLPEKTAETIQKGWLYTGDIGMLDDDGYLFLLDRKNDKIITGGMNVYSTEVENVIQKVPGVKLVAVIGIPHDDWGEQVVAFVMLESDDQPSAEQILEFSKQHLAKYKLPKEIKFVDSLPLTPYGKIDKKTLRQPYWGTAKRAIH